MNLNDYLKQQTQRIEVTLNKLIPQHNAPSSCSSLSEAARYSLLGGGKRLRPILTLATVHTLNGNEEAALIPACALELVHTYSLVHDDLPCMDDDDFRRGKPSLHRAFSEAHAVLAGDHLLTRAFEVLAHAPFLTADQKISLISLLGKSSGGEGMVAGQVMDLEAEGKQIDLATLQLIHQKKTGALLTAAIEFGGVIAGASSHHQKILQQIGATLGLAFQIIDDILDVTASMQKRGQEVASDVINNKVTYVSLLGIEQAKVSANDLLKSVQDLLSQLTEDTSLLALLAQHIVTRNK